MTKASELARRARGLLHANDVGAFVKPSSHQYPHQWNWDAAFVAMGLAHFDLARAREELRTLLAGQWASGMVPHILYPTGASDYFPTPDFWRTEGRGPAFATSGLTQPPILASALRYLYDRAAGQTSRKEEEALAFVREVYPKVLAWHRWLHSARDPEGSGLVAIIHPWESGTDNSTRWTLPLSHLEPAGTPPYARKDYRHVREDERPVPGDYERFMYLIGFFRERNWDAGRLYQESPFLVQDALFNSILYKADGDLETLARRLGEPTAELGAWQARTREAFDARLWDEEAGLYFDFDLRSGELIRESTCAALSPLYAGLPDAKKAKRLVEEHLMNPQEYAPGPDSRYFLPSASKASSLYEPRRYWRGPAWININWFMIQGLRGYGYDDLAETVKAHSLELMERSGFVEYYDPRDGSPCGARDFSWSAALALDLLAEGST